MATAKCHECDKDIEVTNAFCPNCGSQANNIQKAAAGLETLVTLGDAVHKHGPIQADDTSINELCQKFREDCRDRDIWDWIHEVRAGKASYMRLIGSTYMEGKSYLRKDISQGKKWLRLAVKHGDSDASRILELREKWER